MSDAKSPFHRGEKEVQSRLGIQEKTEEKGRRVIRDRIPERNLEFFAQLPLLARSHLLLTTEEPCRDRDLMAPR